MYTNEQIILASIVSAIVLALAYLGMRAGNVATVAQAFHARKAQRAHYDAIERTARASASHRAEGRSDYAAHIALTDAAIARDMKALRAGTATNGHRLFKLTARAMVEAAKRAETAGV